MADRVYPSTKPTTAAAATNGAPPPTVSAPPGATKPQIYNPNRQPYRPHPYTHDRRTRRKRCTCCCTLFWSILVILFLALIVAIAGAVFWVLYKPHSPKFTISNFRIANLNLTSTSESDTSHLSSAMNLTLLSSNPNKKLSFLYSDFHISVLSNSGVLIANGSASGFLSAPKDAESMKLELKNSADLDVESANGLKSDLKKKSLAMKVKAETRVRVKIGKMKTKKVIIRVTCEGISGTAPTGKTTTVASTAGAKCSVDFRFRIWRFTF